eukprot:TRINITY_DN6140_c0_g1_i3.p1 TRINITY_DN6140_c0_g1~~TRINITY_DN6140_c0_g1_i3.p1  ORF type:complete len:813 (-),score=122.56 TRINITY_DN6140_c0_g1_i3:40-2478(-)
MAIFRICLLSILIYLGYSNIFCTGYPAFKSDDIILLPIGSLKQESYVQHDNQTFQIVTCEGELKGQGSLNTSCQLNTSLVLTINTSIIGKGSLQVLDNVSISCPVAGCLVSVNLSGDFIMKQNASFIGGTIVVHARNVSLGNGSSLNSTGLGGDPPPQTSGTPLGTDAAGGGHGGRGASCVQGDDKDQDDTWGGDVYTWSTLQEPWSYGSKGGTSSLTEDYGGGGGGRVGVVAKSVLSINGSILAEGGDGGEKGGGGSGGSIILRASTLEGVGRVSASGGRGWGGGGGGRIGIECNDIEGNVKIMAHGGESLGCSMNAGAAGTRFDIVSQTLYISNDNRSTQTDTLLMDFPTRPLWTNVFVENRAKVLVPLRWSRIQVWGEICLQYEGTLSFGLANYAFSEFELIADELWMSDSIMKVYGALRLTVKILVLCNSKLQIDGDTDPMVGNSYLEGSNLVALKEGSSIISNSNLAVHGQGVLKLAGSGDNIKAERLFVSLFYDVFIGSGSILQAPLNDSSRNRSMDIYCKNSTCPQELINPPEDCNLNASLSFTIQICRVEDIVVEGLVEGRIIHVHLAKTVTVNSGGLITSSGFGCSGGVGEGGSEDSGAGGGGGHGGIGGDGYFNGITSKGGETYGNSSLPCELGSGGGHLSSEDVTAGGGIIVMGSRDHPLSKLELLGMIKADGETQKSRSNETDYESDGGSGGGSGGSVLFFLQSLTLFNSSVLSSSGGNGGQPGGGGGGGGRVHFDWSNIPTGDEYIPIATVNGTILTRGGTGNERGSTGSDGTLTGKKCPKGLYGVFYKIFVLTKIRKD